VPYPRAKPDGRLPRDTWAQAQIPATVRLEFISDGSPVEIAYVTQTDDLGYRGDGAGRTFDVWSAGERVHEEKAELGEGRVRLDTAAASCVVYLPEGMKPALTAIEGSIEPASRGPRWVAYGDSILEGWIASGPSMAWPAIVAREHGLDVANLGYAGAARGEIVSAEHVAELQADVISITHGTNCWRHVPHSTDAFRAGLRAFFDVVRQGHAATPILVVSPILRPDAEAEPNRLGATLSDLRRTMQDVAAERGDVTLIEGLGIVTEAQLGDGIHPDDDGHRALASVIGPRLAELAS
jgi:lysophospholipase L1-like esterase